MANQSLFVRAPNEIKRSILELPGISFSDLKSLRLAHKAFLPLCDEILFRRIRLHLVYDAQLYPPNNEDEGVWPPPPSSSEPSVTIRSFQALASFGQRDIFWNVRDLEILSYTPDARRRGDGDVIIEHRMGISVYTGSVSRYTYGEQFHTQASIDELVNAMDAMKRLNSLYMHIDFLKYLENGQLSLDFLAGRVKSFKMIAPSANGILPSPKFFSNLATLEAHPILLSEAKENGLVNLPNLKDLIVYGGRLGGLDRRRPLFDHSIKLALEKPPFDLNKFLGAQESPFTLASLSLKTLEQYLIIEKMIAFPEWINPLLVSPYLSNLRRLHIDFEHSDFKNKSWDHIWNIFKVYNIHLEDIRLQHISRQLISYLGSYRDTLKSVQIGVQVGHPLHSSFARSRDWGIYQELAAIFWRHVIPAHSRTLQTLRTKPRHNRQVGLRDLGWPRPTLEGCPLDLWSPANNPTAQQAIRRCEQLRDLAVFAVDNGDLDRPFEQLVSLMLKQPKLRKFTFYNDYCSKWEPYDEPPRYYANDRISHGFYSEAHKLLQGALGWSLREEIEILDGFRRRNPLDIAFYPAGRLKTYFDWNHMAWMLEQVKFDRGEPKEGEMELNLDEGEAERFRRLRPLPGTCCWPPEQDL
ncbi:hypothetical protein TWF481_011052 [Arthrobotrys musiformis]|uniref:F-box domain-containing protein n=1 Tax=Arthrobotrys musiformis TaxID=47236 RepID=A0AAV9VX61_9PEZI